jgi:hypothetical protein
MGKCSRMSELPTLFVGGMWMYSGITHYSRQFTVHSYHFANAFFFIISLLL